MTEMRADPTRKILKDSTGIYIRAKRGGKWESIDIAELDLPSLKHFLTSRGGSNPWAENTVAILLGHSPL